MRGFYSDKCSVRFTLVIVRQPISRIVYTCLSAIRLRKKQRYEDLKRFSRDKFKRDAVNESAVKFVPSLSYYLTEYRRKSSECHEVGEHVFDNVRATNSISGLERGSGCIVVNFNQTATATGSSRASRG